VQTRHIHVQQTAGVLSQTSRHHDLLNISPVDIMCTTVPTALCEG
jgi:hypothetical protein